MGGFIIGCCRPNAMRVAPLRVTLEHWRWYWPKPIPIFISENFEINFRWGFWPKIELAFFMMTSKEYMLFRKNLFDTQIIGWRPVEALFLLSMI